MGYPAKALKSRRCLEFIDWYHDASDAALNRRLGEMEAALERKYKRALAEARAEYEAKAAGKPARHKTNGEARP